MESNGEDAMGVKTRGSSYTNAWVECAVIFNTVQLCWVGIVFM